MRSRTIVDQIHYTMGEHGIGVDGRHLMLLADLMTFKVRMLECLLSAPPAPPSKV